MGRKFVHRVTLLVVAGIFLGADLAAVDAQEVKVGFVDLQRVLVGSQRGQDVLAKLRAQKEAKQREVEAEEKEIRQMEADLEKQRSVLSEAARRERDREIRKRRRNLGRTVEDLNRDFGEEERDLRDQLIREISTVVRKYGKEKGYLLIMEARAGGVMYGNDAADLTNEMIAAYDASIRSANQ